MNKVNAVFVGNAEMVLLAITDEPPAWFQDIVKSETGEVKTVLGKFPVLLDKNNVEQTIDIPILISCAADGGHLLVEVQSIWLFEDEGMPLIEPYQYKASPNLTKFLNGKELAKPLKTLENLDRDIPDCPTVRVAVLGWILIRSKRLIEEKLGRYLLSLAKTMPPIQQCHFCTQPMAGRCQNLSLCSGHLGKIQKKGEL
tara:strand:+ start:10260 stop:10856 length:597 start_codon:yes stop_codon:yes gene_type:complete